MSKFWRKFVIALVGSVGLIAAAVIPLECHSARERPLAQLESSKKSSLIEVQGIIRCDTGSPIAGAHVTMVLDTGTSQDTFSDSSGMFHSTLPGKVNRVHIYVNAEGFQVYDIDLDRRVQTTLEIRLVRDKPKKVASMGPRIPKQHNESEGKTTGSAILPLSELGQVSGTSQQCASGSVCLGDNHGNVTVNNSSLPMPRREIATTDASKAILLLRRLGAAHKITISVKNSSQETIAFALQLDALFSTSGWEITRQSSAVWGYTYRELDGSGFSWEGKGFICTGYESDDSTAMTAIEAIKLTRFPCVEKPVEHGSAGGFNLLVGTRGPIED